MMEFYLHLLLNANSASGHFQVNSGIGVLSVSVVGLSLLHVWSQLPNGQVHHVGAGLPLGAWALGGKLPPSTAEHRDVKDAESDRHLESHLNK